MKRVAVLVPFVIGGALIASPIGATADDATEIATKTETIRVISREQPGQFVDNQPTGVGPEDPSIGDMVVFTTRLTQARRRTGRGHIVCTVTQPRPRVASCVATFRLADGQITAQGLVGEGQREGDRVAAAITGGTGRYAGARGTLQARPLKRGRERLTFRFETR